MMLYGLSFSLLLIALQSLQAVLRYERSFILEGEWWRLLTAHFVHFNFTHLALNLVGWWIFLKLGGYLFSLKQLTLNLLISALGISLLLLIFQPHLQWYLGFSGVLYGLLFMVGLQLALQPQRWLGLALIGTISLKLVGDTYNNSQAMYSAQLIGAPVVLVAHGYGLLLGLVLSLPTLYKKLK